ncbi:MAG: T9SS type A sorting domain-containing protein [Prevotellaceae bacterium]|jgi:hypothetical protein|nr:T9SS type A sorting domain-containing protein [Prevotellaceae bacterium]
MKRLLLLFTPALLLLGAREAGANVIEPLRESNSWDDLYYSEASKTSYSQFFSGAGTAANPFQIKNSNDLARLAWCVKRGVSESSSGKHFVLTADINLSGRKWGRIGHRETLFMGVFDGGGHFIRNMNTDLPGDSDRGLFGATENATIKNLKIESSNIRCGGSSGMKKASSAASGASNTYVGMLIGLANGATTIENCHVLSGDVTANNHFGGFVGWVVGTINISRSSCNTFIDPYVATGNDQVGGFIGVLNNKGKSTLTDCIFSGSMLANDEWNNTFGYMVGGHVKESADNATLELVRCVADGRCTFQVAIQSSWTQTFSFFVGFIGKPVTLTNCYYVQDNSVNNLSIQKWGGAEDGSKLTGSPTKWAPSAVSAAASATTLNSLKGGDPVWAVHRDKLTTRSVLVTSTLTNASGSGKTTTTRYSPHTFKVKLAQSASNAFVRVPVVTSGVVSSSSTNSTTSSSVNQYPEGYKGNGEWELTVNASAEYVTVNEAEVPYPALNLSAVFDQWQKTVTVSGNRVTSNLTLSGKWQLYKKIGTGAWARVSDMGAAASFSYTETNVGYDQQLQYGVRYVLDNDALPADPNGGNGKVASVSTAPSITVNNLKATNNSNDVTLSFTLDYRLDNINTNHYYTIERKKNGGTYAEVVSKKAFAVTPAGSKFEKTYTYTDNSAGNDCNPSTYRVKVNALDHAFTSKEVSGHTTGSSSLEEVSATKREYSNSVRVSWTTNKSNPDESERYKVWRRVIDKTQSEWSEFATINTDEPSYTYIDDRALPDVYYEYRVEVYKNCSDTYTVIDAKTDIGFAESLGAASGRITYGSGTAVANVSVLVKRSEEGEQSGQYASLRSNGGGQTADWKPKDAYFNEILKDDFTLQLYLRPDFVDDDMWFASIGNGTNDDDGNVNTIWLKLLSQDKGSAYKILSSSGAGTTKDFETPFTIRSDRFSHVTLVRQGGKLTLYVVNDDNLDSVYLQHTSRADAYTQTTFSNSSIRLGYDLKGNIDEVRFWGRALGEAEILRDYNRRLAGNETDLKAYWMFDEPVEGYFFDASRVGTAFNKNHGTHALPSDAERIPSDAQLAFKGITDASGNYYIRGIAFSGEGTSYNFVPLLGVHRFEPTQHLRYISNASLVHNSTDFTDISSFKVSGRVVYADSDYPVEGAQLNVDGAPASRDGELITTNDDGEFEVDVPIGEHFISVSKDGHVFENGGRYPREGRHNFQNPITGLRFADNTLVRVVGRVAGGNTELGKQLGFGLSKANIGKATVTLTTRNDSYRLNLTSADVAKTFRLPAPYGDHANGYASSATFKSTARGSTIEVETNPVTGEFAVELPPVPYNITGVKTKALDSDRHTFRFDKLTLDIAPNVVDTLTYTDTLGYAYALVCHDTLRIAYYSDPVFEVKDLGNPYGAFGDSIYVYTRATSTDNVVNDTLRLYSVDGNGAVRYAAGHPVFSQRAMRYAWEISALEKYENIDAEPKVVEVVPMYGQPIYINNALASHAVFIDTTAAANADSIYDLTPSSNTVTLNAEGKCRYEFQVGFPKLSGDNLLSATVTLDHNGRTITWNNGAGDGKPFRGYLLGQVPSDGSNFTTKGPDYVEIVLHDPPGTGSYAYLEKGSTITSTFSSEETANSAMKHSGTISVAPTFVSSAGIGFSVVTNIEPKVSTTVEFESVSVQSTGHTYTTANTVAERISTSASASFVGSSADVYIGKSVNRLFGKVRDLNFYPVEDVPAGVTPSTGVSAGEKTYSLFPREVLAEGVEFNTSFAYTQEHILSSLIPNTEELRNNLITVVDAIPPIENVVWGEEKKPVYYSTLSRSNPAFGANGTYVCYIYPQSAEKDQNKLTDEVCEDVIARINAILSSPEIGNIAAAKRELTSIRQSLESTVVSTQNAGKPTVVPPNTEELKELIGDEEIATYSPEEVESIAQAIADARQAVNEAINASLPTPSSVEQLRKEVLWSLSQAVMQEHYPAVSDLIQNLNDLQQPLKNIVSSITGQLSTVTAQRAKAALNDAKLRVDQVLEYNRWVEKWKDVIRSNEEDKVQLFKLRADVDVDLCQNRSFDAGASVSSSTTVEWEKVDFTKSAKQKNSTQNANAGLFINNAGVEYSITAVSNEQVEAGSSAGVGSKCSFGYELSEDGADALTVDVYDPISENMLKLIDNPESTLNSSAKIYSLHGYIFQTRAGQTSCPYEGEEMTRFYTEDGAPQRLSYGTFQIEKPELYIDNAKEAAAANVPSGREATFTLQLQNLSDANLPVTYQLSVDNTTNPDGLILSLDGTPLTSPRLFRLEYGEELVKTLEARQSSVDILDYSGVTLSLASTCDNISSEATVEVHYIPSSTYLTLTAPSTLANIAEGAQATFRIDEYDREFRGFASIRLQYKNVNDHTWVTLREFVNDTLLLPITGSGQELISSSAITYTCDLQPLVDGEYDFRAVSVSLLGAEEITESSEEVRIVKDMKAPQLLSSASPASGILTPEGEISVQFNENIRATYVKDGNISVKAILNGHKVSHATALKLSGGAPASTEATVALADRSFSVEAWFTRTLGQAGTLVAHGEAFSLGFSTDNKVVVTFGDATFTSVDTLASSGWQYISFAYNNDAKTFSVYALSGDETKTLFTAKPVAAQYNGAGRLYVGAKAKGDDPFTGAVHDLSLWSRTRVLGDLNDNAQAKTGKEQSLAGYWPLTEGHGAVGADKARSRHLTLHGANPWYLNNVNKAVSLSGSSYVMLSADKIPVTTAESFSVELWFRGGAQTGAATLFSCGDGEVGQDSSLSLSIGFDAGGTLTLKANGDAYSLSSASYLDSTWRHFALNVLRNGSVIAYIDGTAVKQLPAAAVAQMANATIALGARRYANAAGSYSVDSYFHGEIDEVRIWKSARTADAIRQNIYSRLNGAESGLVAYYPFEKTSTDAYNQLETTATWEDCINPPASTGLTAAGAATAVGDADFTEQAPALKEVRALESVAHSWTASSNKIVINITEPEYRIEGATLEFSVADILDLNDNPLAQPISWTAYANMNRLRWSDDEVSITKEHLREATREVSISNESGKEETWSLSSLPSWLTASKLQGNIKPLGSEKITFTVHPAMPVGSYEDIIYLTGNNQVDVPLLLSLKVTTQIPSWDVNPSDFEYSMSLIGQLRFEGVVSEDTEDMVAAFIDGVCVGRASPIYYPRYNATLVTLDIYGTREMSGSLITFKAWNASVGKLHPVVTTGATTVTFANNTLVGSVTAPLALDAESKIEQQIALEKGWSWLSFNTRPSNMSLANVLSSVQLSVALIKGKTAFSVPNGSAWSGDLQVVEIGKMYKIHLNSARTLTLAGDPVDPQATPIDVKSGWSWIGYTPQESLPLEDALADLDAAEGDLIKGQSSGFAIYSGGAWVGSLATLASGSGYLYSSKATGSKQFFFPNSSAAASESSTSNARSMAKSRGATPAAATRWTPVGANTYSGNMSIIAVVKNGDRTLASCEVGVFAGSECRGAASTSGGLLFITVAGDDKPAQLTFKVYDPSSNATINVSQTLTYSDDAIVGATAAPYVISLSSGATTTDVDRLTVAGIRAYPTVVSGSFYVTSESAALRAITVYSVSGSVAKRLSDVDGHAATLDLSALPQGAYLVAIEASDGKVHTVKILVEK